MIRCVSQGVTFEFHDLVLSPKPSNPLVLVAKCIAPGCMYSCAPDTDLAVALFDMGRVEAVLPC